MLSGDPFERWVQARPHNSDDFLRGLVTLMYVDDEGRSDAIGNGFVVYAHENAAICMTASHNFEHIKALQRRRRMPSHPSLPQDFSVKGTQYLDNSGVYAFYVGNGQPTVCQVDQISYQKSYDVAVFAIHFEVGLGTQKAFLWKTAVDFAMPNIGDEVALLGNELIYKEVGEGKYTLEQKLQFFFGSVTNLISGVDRMGQYYSFETTIPIRPGLSGAPILKKPEVCGTMIACGVASSDLSPKEAFDDCKVAGCSHGASLWPSLALGIVAHHGAEYGFLSLFDLVQRGILENKTVDVETRVIVKTDDTEIIYVDTRISPPSTHVLRTPKHPLIEMADKGGWNGPLPS